MKNLIKKIIALSGYEIKKLYHQHNDAEFPGTDKRPVGDMKLLLEDLKKRGLIYA
ncbi:MAG: hypothetical protein JWR61_5296 [Ferruginibacter sp.]|uniref:hypothetical protein n=1 Tax=Ferruginibacter sp. TaxID=1940288 RepID=UPI0026595837|nr:hypothetical protein [Ferruginibacter sp.]MDB5280341.1 hypothetical protein [Ferruginibacter sp.]